MEIKKKVELVVVETLEDKIEEIEEIFQFENDDKALEIKESIIQMIKETYE